MKYGISDLSVIPIRKNPSDTSEMVNQILFGEHFIVLENNNQWSKICLAHDNYEGWICNKQWIEINKESYEQLNKEVPTLTTDILDIIKKKNYSQPIVIGSVLPSYKSGHAMIEKEMYKFEGLTTTGFTNKEKIIKTAFIYLNAPYLWGGRSPLGIDCSGLTQMTYRLQGILLPRDAYQQEKLGKIVPSLKQSKEGDLAFFGNEEKISHVGIILKEQYIIHASGYVRIDNIDQKGILNKTSGLYTHKLKTIKRLT